MYRTDADAYRIKYQALFDAGLVREKYINEPHWYCTLCNRHLCSGDIDGECGKDSNFNHYRKCHEFEYWALVENG